MTPDSKRPPAKSGGLLLRPKGGSIGRPPDLHHLEAIVPDGLPGNRRGAGNEPLQRCGFQYSPADLTVPGKQVFFAAEEDDSARNDAKPDLTALFLTDKELLRRVRSRHRGATARLCNVLRPLTMAQVLRFTAAGIRESVFI